MSATYGTTRGFRNHNPCNVRPCPLPDVWKGQGSIDNNEPDPPYSQFEDTLDENGIMQEADFWGLRAGARNFESYQSKDGCATLRAIIYRHAPPTDNNDTVAYLAAVSQSLGINPDETISLENAPELTLDLMKSVIHEEESTDPYPDALIRAAIAAA
jgi:hypothetical protein